MSLRLMAIIALGLGGFASIFAYTLHLQGTERRLASADQIPPQNPFSGTVTVVEGDRYRVGSRNVKLCGVRTRTVAAMPMIRSMLENKRIDCVPVGLGTPCDGRIGARVDNAGVAQCFLNGVDIAETLTSRGYLCDHAPFSGGVYTSC